MNRIIIDYPQIHQKRIEYHYRIEGDWKVFFVERDNFFIEYNCDISDVTPSIAMIPILTNILPIAWLNDAEICVPVCDKAFYESVSEFKKGYEMMYPMLEFKGKFSVQNIEENHFKNTETVAAFYSGGVDATETLIRHISEKPILLSIWGFNIVLEDVDGWNHVLTQLDSVNREFGLETVTIRSNFRTFIKVSRLDELVRASNLLWFYGFQNGIGILGLAAPVSYVHGISVVYVASTNTDEKCSSDPTIDGKVRFADTRAVHDAATLFRQEKIHTIIADSRQNNRTTLLNVCWTKHKAAPVLNCCKCAKCLQTMLGIYAEGEDPRRFGFDYIEEEWAQSNRKMQYRLNRNFNDGWMAMALEAMHQNWKYEDVRDDLKWFYNMKHDDFGQMDISDCLLKPIRESGYEQKVLVWSACVKTDAVVDALKKNGIEIYGYIDQKHEIMDKYNGYKVFEKSILTTDRFFVYVGMDTPYYGVIDYLKENGYVEDIDYFYPNS